MKNKFCRKLITPMCLVVAFMAARSISAKAQPANSVRADGDVVVKQMLRGGPEPGHRQDAAKDPPRKARAWQLYSVWTARGQRDVVPEILPYLKDEYGIIRRSAARMLGQLQNPAAEAALEVALIPNDGDNAIDPDVVNWALARIRSRELKGEAKVSAWLKSVGLTLEQAAPLTAGFVAAKSLANGSRAETIINELVEGLYSMAKRGENITPIVERLTFYSGHLVKLKAAPLPVAEEIETIVDYVAKLDIVRAQDDALEDHLIRLGTPAVESVLRRLAAIEKEQSPYGRSGFVSLFRVAGQSGDARAVPLLRLFENNQNPNMQFYAVQTRETAEHRQDWNSLRSLYPPLP